MKYIITESRLSEVIHNYLDTKNESWYFSDAGDGEFTIYDGEKPIIRHRINASNEERYFIFSPSLVWGLSDLFGIQHRGFVVTLINWLNKTFDSNVEYPNWDYDMDENVGGE